MAGTEDFDFQALSDKFFKVLDLALTLCAAIFDLCLVLLSYAYRTFWAVAQTPSETLWNDFLTVLVSVKNYVVANPITAILILLTPGAIGELWKFFMYCLGFRERGVQRGSYAAKYQSTNYGGNTPKGSTFARLQAQGTKGKGSASGW